jgi:hypothetical protein
MYKIFCFSFLLLFINCQKNDELPAWINEKIEGFKSEPVTNPPRSIYQYEYNGQTVYFIPQICCDIPSILYDVRGNELCRPDGGITGTGDGKCPDFMETKTNEKLIWQDNRQ